MIDRIRLTKSEKKMLRMLGDGLGIHELSKEAYYSLYALEDEGLVKAVWTEGGIPADASLTARGREYLAINPRLRNPFDWWAALGILSVITAAR